MAWMCSARRCTSAMSSPAQWVTGRKWAWGIGSWAVLFLTPFSLSASSLPLLRTSAACEILHNYWEPSNFGLKPLKPWDKINAFSFICFCLIFYHSNRNVSRTLVRPSRSRKPFFTISKCAGPETTEERKRCVKAVSLLLICFPLIFLRLEFQHLFLSSL